jgi:hypothetical protein
VPPDSSVPEGPDDAQATSAGGASRLIERPVADRVSAMPEDFRFVAAVAEFGMVLRGSPYRGSASLPGAAELARSALGRDDGGYRAGFLRSWTRQSGWRSRPSTADEPAARPPGSAPAAA